MLVTDRQPRLSGDKILSFRVRNNQIQIFRRSTIRRHEFFRLLAGTVRRQLKLVSCRVVLFATSSPARHDTRPKHHTQQRQAQTEKQQVTITIDNHHRQPTTKTMACLRQKRLWFCLILLVISTLFRAGESEHLTNGEKVGAFVARNIRDHEVCLCLFVCVPRILSLPLLSPSCNPPYSI